MIDRLDHALDSPQTLTAAVITAAEILGLVRAEMGRILGYRCAEFSALYTGSALLEPGSVAAQRGRAFVRLYQMLFDLCEGERAKMVHWLRRDHPELGSSPFLLIVDEGRLDSVISYLGANRE